jgi:hypothetical protein
MIIDRSAATLRGNRLNHGGTSSVLLQRGQCMKKGIHTMLLLADV